MQVYDGLDILTNKATEEEMQGIPHHMISVVDRSELFDVHKFKTAALPLVEKILSKGKIPYIVGGTNYYIESILWKLLIEQDGDTINDFPTSEAKRLKRDSSEAVNPTPVLAYMKERQGRFTEADVKDVWSKVELYQALQEVDSVRALKVHPNDTRKIVRSLQIFFRTGKKHSELIEGQWTLSSDSDNECEQVEELSDTTPSTLTRKLGGPLRFSNCICLWIQADRKILITRIENRVDQMVERGLKLELDNFVDQMIKENRKWDFQEGQLQSIGVKEFQDYILLPLEERETDVGKKCFEEGLERLKITTRQYAKRQVQWISQRFLKSCRRQLPPVYGLNGNETDAKSWNDNVTLPAIQILDAHIHQTLPLSSHVQEKLLPVTSDDEGDLMTRTCDVCSRVLQGSLQWREHMKSAKHWKMVKRRKLESEKEQLSTNEKDIGAVVNA
ncbi:tRNA dimethylallyltransferase, mitochondrial [Orchesella cincta]|uniref:tRNA dimethylallyltransferase, mitochondrial n=1 Tax=Orchesella cincta TaxID=48709 RepID=A0A1D2MJP3_ORCCI|nr:tRNA dimethylallyltransferase, mitochondrial [Orchesella cincta]